MKLLLALSAGALASLGGRARAQTIFVHDGPSATVREVSGPSDPLFCGYPDGPVKSQFTTPGAFACPLPTPLAPPPNLLGDVAVQRPKDTVWVTDGLRIAEYNAQGIPQNSFAVPPGLLTGPVLGLGVNGAAGTLWVTDGARALELSPPGVRCNPPGIVSGPFTLPPIGGVLAPATDIDWNPATGTLWVCTAAGFVGNIVPGGPLLSSFQAVPGPCFLQPPLLGLAVDSSVPGATALFLTDGLRIANVTLTGGLAPKTFGQPSPCFSVPDGLAYGVGFSSRGIYYGQGTPGGPELGSFGEAVIPTTSGLGVTLSGAPPGAAALLPFSISPLCPAILVLGDPVLIFPSAFALFTHTVDASGGATQMITIPPTTAVGIEVFYQWFVLFGGPSPAAEGSPLLSSGAGSMRTGFR